MTQESIMKLINKIEQDGYIDCNSQFDDDQFNKIMSALKNNISLQQRNDEQAADNSNLLIEREMLEKRLKHLLNSHTIAYYDEVNNGEYIKNINELDEYMKTSSSIICTKLLTEKGIDRIGNFKVLRTKNDIKIVYEPIKKTIALKITVVESKEDKLCPLCNKALGQYPALSRKDNKTEICSNCGMLEALEAFNNSLLKDAEKHE